MEPIDVLIVDDEPFVVRSLSYVLQREGLRFDVAADGEQGLDKALSLQPKIVFLDIMMPKKTGYDVCAALRNDKSDYSPYIIMLTAKGQEDDKIKSLTSGANEYIAKPFSPQAVIQHIREVLDSLR